jgi:hypothetical protein
MVHARLYPGVSWQNGHADDPVANVTAVGILLAAFIDSTASHPFHPEDRLVKMGHGSQIMSIHR